MKRIKTITFLLFTIIYGFVNCQNETNRGYKVSVGDLLPALEMNMRNGKVWTNKNLENKVVVIQFTGSWCSVCRREMPELEKKVWQELLNIPFNKTRTYLEQSKALGDVKAIRAVASANGKNPIWIVIPCHRVIGSDGSLTGYAGGIWRKKWLLQHENPNKQQSLF